MTKTSKAKKTTAASRDTEEQLFLVALGQRLRALRDRGGITRKALSQATGVSERHLANIHGTFYEVPLVMNGRGSVVHGKDMCRRRTTT